MAEEKKEQPSLDPDDPGKQNGAVANDDSGKLNSINANGDATTPSGPIDFVDNQGLTDKDKIKERATWGKKAEFLLSAISYAVGLGNVWRFPHLCYENGGGAFLIPYLIMLVFAGIPLFFLELAFGQFASLGPITIWRICPIFKGLGYTMTVIALIIGIYYNVILALTFYYFFASFTNELPWSKCGNKWNTDSCVERQHHGGYITVNYTDTTNSSSTDVPPNEHQTPQGGVLTPWPNNVTSPAEEYWKYHVLGMAEDTNFGNLGHAQPMLVLCLFFAWVVVFLCIAKGIQTSGKVVYFTAPFPYFVLFILLIRGVTLEGAADGITFYLKPDFNKMKNVKVWKDAAVQILYSLGLGVGTVLTLGSYNKFKNNCHRDAIIVALINCGTSIFAGFVIFSVLGYMAHASNLDVEHVVEKGPGLAFIAYPEALAMLPGAPFWSIIFFFMLMTLGLGSQFPTLECIMTAALDEFPRFRPYKMWLTMALCMVLFLLGLPCCTQGGMYVVELMDTFATAFPLLTVAFCECIVVNWIYGFKRFSGDIELMLGFRPNYYWAACWLGCTPVIILFILVFSCIEYDGFEYNGYVYPKWAEFVGWLMVLASLLMTPIWAAIQFWRCVQTCHNLCWVVRGPAAMKTLNLASLIQPTEEWGPALQEHREQQVHYNRESDMVNILDITAVEETETTKHSTQTDEQKVLKSASVVPPVYTNPSGDSYI